jgi:hypothetical protein
LFAFLNLPVAMNGWNLHAYLAPVISYGQKMIITLATAINAILFVNDGAAK